MSGLRYVRPDGVTIEQMRANMRCTPLFAMGDCILVWVNEGDFWTYQPTDVAVEDRDRKEYERLKAKFGFNT